MSRFIEGADRSQVTLFPDRLEDWIEEDNRVRVIDAFIDGLDLQGLGFERVIPAETGRPAYHPGVLLKLYVYGYLNRVQSSRRLEREAGRNVELMWLLGRLAPDFKTIADFRKDNTEAIRLVCREFVMVCRKLNLFADAFVAIDGSKLKAVNNRDRNYTQAKLKRRLEIIDKSIEKYLAQIASADRQEATIAKKRTDRLEEKIANLKEEIERLNEIEVKLLASPDKQISLTDPDARAMKTRGSGIVGYNVQAAVDTKHHLMVSHEVNNKGSDRSQLFNIAEQAKEAIGTEELNVVADRGYYKAEEILACEEAGITTYLPKTQTSNNLSKGYFDKRDFIYNAKNDEYVCPAGERLIRRTRHHERNQVLYRYWCSTCQSCAIKSQCTTGKERRVTRWEHEATLDRLQARLDDEPEMMRIRRSTVEHPFGTIKMWMGATHFLMKTLKRVNAERSLHVLAYNLKRVIIIMGPQSLIMAIQA